MEMLYSFGVLYGASNRGSQMECSFTLLINEQILLDYVEYDARMGKSVGLFTSTYLVDEPAQVNGRMG